MTTSTMPEMPAEQNYAGRSHAEYRRARAHSRHVRLLKILLPLLAALVIVAFAVVSWIDSVSIEGVGIESVTLRDGKLVMQNPVMSGQGSDARPYSMRALRAIQDLTATDVIVLEEIVADLPISNGDMAVLNAASGVYNRTAETLKFDEAFTVTSEDGLSVEMQSADIDLANGALVTTEPVSISSSEASVVAQSMEMQDKGRVIIFHDKVRMTIKPTALKPKDGAAN
ncbi:LPS export ABC transporter periplasmic protein LptC [Hoeflea ulvae]|uniref:LPS export ABC transporter periplasmic protein LptC n=1 Tax=Hoeflea ulvae TaxID=2983764 RepID=A0ABT3YBF2_9HYPH|nr:LPS export ABC transporter periplasmic protein LptC [Hoeflea ulvae]MCY0093200.1 LPS export ABC transporter periplasmic protein LptC [Hoeflea ulvae]